MWNKSKHINTLIRQTLLLLFVGVASLYTNAQHEYNPYVKAFNATAIDGKVYLSWTTRAGFICQDIHIEVSRDSLHGFERKGTYYGICGDASEQHYTYVLEEPILNTLNYLKLELGNIGYSNTINVMVIKPQENLLILPHPIEDNSIIHFENKERSAYIFEVYDTQGNKMLATETIDEQIAIGQYFLPQGLFYYTLFALGKKQYRGKLYVNP